MSVTRRSPQALGGCPTLARFWLVGEDSPPSHREHRGSPRTENGLPTTDKRLLIRKCTAQPRREADPDHRIMPSETGRARLQPCRSTPIYCHPEQARRSARDRARVEGPLRRARHPAATRHFISNSKKEVGPGASPGPHQTLGHEVATTSSA